MIGRDLSMWDPGGSYSVEFSIDPWKRTLPWRRSPTHDRRRSLLRANSRLDRAAGRQRSYFAAVRAPHSLRGMERP